MAKYGLETETTVHLKGMKVVDGQDDAGDDTQSPSTIGPLVLNMVVLNPQRFAQVIKRPINEDSWPYESDYYLTNFFINNKFDGKVDIPSETSIIYKSAENSAYVQARVNNLYIVSQDKIPAEGTYGVGVVGEKCIIYFPKIGEE